MSDAISTTRLAEIRRHDGQHDTVRSVLGPNSAETHRHELLAEVDRLTTALAEADAREKSVRDRREQTARALGETQFDRDQARARVAELEAERGQLGTFDVSIRTSSNSQEATLWLECAGLPYRNFKQTAMRLDDLVTNALAHAARCPGLKQQQEAAALDRSDGNGQ